MIGAALSSGFGSVIGSVSSKIARLQEKCQSIKLDERAGREFIDLKEQTLRVRKEFEATGGRSKELGASLTELKQKTIAARMIAQQYGLNIDKVAQQTKALGIVSQQTEAKIGRMQARMARAQARGALKGELLGVAGMGYALGRAIQPAIRFEESFADVKKVVDGSDAMITNLRRDALGLTRELPMAGEEINKIMAAAAQSGISGRTAIVDFTRTTAKMGVAFDISAEEAGAAMAEIKNSCGLTQTQMVNLGDAMNHLSNNTASAAGDIVEYMRRVGAVGKIVGMTEVQMAALGATFKASGTAPEIGARASAHLLMTLASITKQSKSVKSAFQDMGYKDLAALERSTKIDPQKTILGFLERVSKQKNVIGALSGTMGTGFADDIAKLVKGKDLYGKAIDLVAKKENYAGSMEAEFQARAKTTANAIQLMKNRLTITSIHLGSVFLPMLVDAANAIGSVADKFSKWAEKNPQLVKTLGALVVGFVGMKAATVGSKWLGSYVLDGLDMMNGGLQKIRPSVIQAQLAVLKMKGAGSVFGGIVSSIGGRFSSFKTDFLNDVSAVKSGLSAVGSMGKTGLVKLAGVIKSTAVAIGSFTKTSLIALGNGIRNVSTVIIGAMRAIGASMMTNPLGWIIGAIALAAVIIWKWKEVKAFFGGLWKSIKTACAPIGGIIKSAFSGAIGWVVNKIEWLESKWQALKSKFSGPFTTPTTKAGKSVPVPEIGHALGGIFDKPHVAAISEGGKREAIIPLEGDRKRAQSLFIETGTELGLIPRKQQKVIAPFASGHSISGKTQSSIPPKGNKERARPILLNAGMILGLVDTKEQPSKASPAQPAQMQGHALGGIFDKPHVAAISEGGKREAIIPLEGNRARARSIYAAAGSALGIKQQYISGGSACVIKAEFNINVSSSTEGEKIAAYIKQALADLERKAKSRERGRFADAPVFG